MLNLSYNKLNYESIRNLYICKNLRILDLAANNLEQLPDDMFHFENLEELNLSSNYFSSFPSVGSPVMIFKTLGAIRRLKRLNLARNKFFKFHSEMLDQHNDFNQLRELDISFNMVDNERYLWYLTQTRAINVVNITGNPLAMPSRVQKAYAALEYELQKNLSAVIINDFHLIDDKGYIKRKTNKPSNWPYPNPIKLLSREVQKEIKGEYLNAEVMRKGITLPISDIRPNTNIESEIFPQQLTKEAQAKDVFTPPGHHQMRFTGPEQKHAPKAEQTDDGSGFFITEDVRPDGMLPIDGVEQIQEEKSYGSETIEDRQISQ